MALGASLMENQDEVSPFSSLRSAKFAPSTFFHFLSDKFNRLLFQSRAGADRLCADAMK